MRKPIKYVEKAVVIAAQGTWAVFERLNRVKPNPSPTPKWSDKPLLKSYEKSKPPLGWRSGSRFSTGTCRMKC
jgi:7,8-dihydro-6-hydroxymethylpterin dimethyltransferase